MIGSHGIQGELDNCRRWWWKVVFKTGDLWLVGCHRDQCWAQCYLLIITMIWLKIYKAWLITLRMRLKYMGIVDYKMAIKNYRGILISWVSVPIACGVAFWCQTRAGASQWMVRSGECCRADGSSSTSTGLTERVVKTFFSHGIGYTSWGTLL